MSEVERAKTKQYDDKLRYQYNFNLLYLLSESQVRADFLTGDAGVRFDDLGTVEVRDI